MGKHLVVVESPAKAKTINKILGRDFVVESSMGHVRDLPVRTLGVDVDHGFEPKYVLIRGRRKVVDKLKKLAEKSDRIYLAPDPDREGEAIAWHLGAVLQGANKDAELLRVQYNEITPAAVKRAFDQPGQIDMCRVNAQQARRVLDRLVGYMVSPMLWRRVRRGLSAGRVQSVALRLVCEREQEIQAFTPEPYWVHGARVRKLMVPLDPFTIRLTRIDGAKAEIGSEETSQAILSELEGRPLKVVDIGTKDIRKRPSPPYITSTLQQAGSSHCGFSPKRTMSLAQSLYEGIDLGEGPVGLITYMRTDSVHLANDAVDACRGFITDSFGKDYCPDKPNRYRSRAGAQEAHEAIRPTDVRRTPDSLKGKLDPAALKLYGLIWRRFVACQMSPAVLRQRTVTIEALKPSGEGREFMFSGSSSDIVFPGYMKVTGADRKKASAEAEERLPELNVGEGLTCIEWLAEHKETQPPPRYSETSLVGALERHGVGRPSTYAQTVSTLYDRKYVEREKRMLRPTDLGTRVNELLVSTLADLFDVSFTADMEKKLDAVEEGAQEWTSMLGDFYGQFQKWLEKTKAPAADPELTRKVIDLFRSVSSWAEPVKRGRRTYSDESFVGSLGTRLDEEDGEVSERQFETLVRMACNYAEQIEDVEQRLTAMGLGELVQKIRNSRPEEGTIRRLDMLGGVELEEGAEEFVGSLKRQVESGRALSEAQRKVLDRILVGAGSQIDGFEALAEELGIDTEAVSDVESGELLDGMKGVHEWKPPVQRGKRTFDDKAFYESLSDYYGKKGFLSERQRGALRRMVGRYREQVTNYTELDEKYQLSRKKT